MVDTYMKLLFTKSKINIEVKLKINIRSVITFFGLDGWAYSRTDYQECNL